MPVRISRSSIVNARSVGSRKRQRQRALHALPIAEAANPEQLKIKRHRLGNLDGALQHKRRRVGDLDQDESNLGVVAGRFQQKKRSVGEEDDLDVSSGSDGEGHRWKMGEVEEGDDSDIDSDEAFGESDEERFSGFNFRGSAKAIRPRRNVHDKNASQGMRDESHPDSNAEANGEDLGDEAVDLATMLDDQPFGSGEDGPAEEVENSAGEDDDSSEEPGDDSNVEGFSDTSMSDVDEDDPAKLSRLQDLITSLPSDSQKAQKKSVNSSVQESSAPTNLSSSKKLDLSSFGAAANNPFLKNLYRKDVKPSKRNGVPETLEVPLPKRQQDRLDRVAAAKKANESLDRWTDTVKFYRRAEHISFPLKDPNASHSLGENKLLPTTFSTPFNDLEDTIQNILQESGLASKDGKDAEEKIREFEELQTNKMPLEEVEARRAELRKARELMFREETRAKRVKKIKSKAYRRVHRREREKLADQERTLRSLDGVHVSEDEREYNDRRRAEERMGAKHRDSKWAKAVKQTGQAAWDEDARSGVTEMARRNEELRKRMEGKNVQNEDEDNSDLPSSEDDEDSDSDSGLTHEQRLDNQLTRLSQVAPRDGSSKLSSMAFMQRAEAARKAQNDEAIEELKRDLRGDAEKEDKEDTLNMMQTGRRKFGLEVKSPSASAAGYESPIHAGHDKQGRDRGHLRDEDDEVDVIVHNEELINRAANAARKGFSKSSGGQSRDLSKQKVFSSVSTEAGNAWIGQVKSNKRKDSESLPNALKLHKISTTKPNVDTKRQSKGQQIPDEYGWTTVRYKNDQDLDSEDSDEDGETPLIEPIKMSSRGLVQLGFAGEDVETEFAKEKEDLVEDEDEKIVDETLPGWGSWVGEDLSKREQKRNKGKVLTKKEGIKPSNRRDAKLDRVIINERRVKKNAKYLATTLPYQFETREQYERSLHLPKGREWNTKQTFQDSVKPRMLMKPGIIVPPENPMF